MLCGRDIIFFVPFSGFGLMPSGRKKSGMSSEARKPEENPLDEMGPSIGDRLEGRVVEVKNASVNRIDGGQVNIHQSSTRSLRASAVHMEDSAAFSVRAGSADIAESAVFFVSANDLKVQKVTSTLLLGRRVEASETRSILLLALQVRGSVKTILTPLTAFAAGAGFATVFFLLRFIVSKLIPASRQVTQKTEDHQSSVV
jgi:hypothetical protein